MSLNFEIFQSRTAAGVSIEGVDFAVTPYRLSKNLLAKVTGSDSGTALPFVALGLYVGQVGNLTCKTIDGSVFTMVSASGFIPGLISEISSSTTAGSIIAFK